MRGQSISTGIDNPEDGPSRSEDFGFTLPDGPITDDCTDRSVDSKTDW